MPPEPGTAWARPLVHRAPMPRWRGLHGKCLGRWEVQTRRAAWEGAPWPVHMQGMVPAGREGEGLAPARPGEPAEADRAGAERQRLEEGRLLQAGVRLGSVTPTCGPCTGSRTTDGVAVGPSRKGSWPSAPTCCLTSPQPQCGQAPSAQGVCDVLKFNVLG